MHITIGYLLGKADDFKNCLTCGSFNWYENSHCHNCGSTRFRDTTQKDVDEYAKAREQDEHFCDECEIDV